MKFAVALCVTVLVACYQSANADQPAPQRINSGQLRRSSSFGQPGSPRRSDPSRPRSPRFNPPSPTNSRMPSKITIAGGQIQKTQLSRPNPPPMPSSFMEPPEPLPTKAIAHLGKYKEEDMMHAQERFDDMDSADLERGLTETKLFAPLVERARRKFRKYRDWTDEQRKDYIRRKVAGQLSQLEKAYGKDFAEEILIRAMLDKGY